ncbi:MAG: beta-ketoacyl-ACP synthase III [Armatimonadetes bacterium]|nr:beta-ketoacyl-ACP synthase III [Armatimonadota bacterium]NIM23592.1 beta-ketoacyl-ACP synthase III [Armatimonadota bacterium]NIM67458.1 beta-ketoacyl-ACP synthase III [Armatimonadota bacterium]NIM75955.1 beta-ketoacyl-ACP synthase III [Armatimonadota bacterium]NIN05644.1 beta-ketoacyl-ACP synthase III [Armatimonadota bacterium]
MLAAPVGIHSLGAYLPSRVLTNFDLEKMVDTSDEWIRTRTGISSRRIAAAEEATSDLCIKAARQALERASWPAEKLDLIIVATVTPDMCFPSTASLVQGTLGAERASAFDLMVGCTGFIYGLVMGASGIAAGAFESVLVIGAECLSRITNWEDRSTCVLFGDGAAATLLRPTEEGRGLLSFVLGNDAGGADKLKINAGGSRMPATEETVRAGEHFLKMEGNEVFKFAVRIMEEASLQALERAGLDISDVTLLVPHQANVRIMDAAAKRLNLPPERIISNVDRYGNTSAASIPIALDEAVQSGRLKKGDIALCVSFGAGLSWAAAVLRW